LIYGTFNHYKTFFYICTYWGDIKLWKRFLIYMQC
jgi:hypothetical protein